MKKRGLLVLLFLASGCQSMRAELPASRMVSPEAMGASDKRVGFQAGVSAVQLLTISEDASVRPPDLSRPTLEKSADVSGQFGYATTDRLDLTLKSAYVYAPVMLEAKYQLIGEPSASAKAGNFSLAITGALGYWDVERSGDQSGIFGAGGYKWNSDVIEKLVDVGLIAGYRVSDRTLLYLGAFTQNVKLEGRIHDDLSQNGSSPAADYSIDYTGKQRGADIGVMLGFGAASYLAIEGVYSHMEFDNDMKNWFVGGSAALGARF